MIDPISFFKEKITELNLTLKNGFEPTIEGKFWKVILKNGDFIELEWQSLALDDKQYKELWVEYNKEAGGVIFDLIDYSGKSNPIVVIPNEQIISVEIS